MSLINGNCSSTFGLNVVEHIVPVLYQEGDFVCLLHNNINEESSKLNSHTDNYMLRSIQVVFRSQNPGANIFLSISQ